MAREGATNGRARLSCGDVMAARAAYRAGASLDDLAATYPVGRGAIRAAVVGETWAHLPGAAPLRGYSGAQRLRHRRAAPIAAGLAARLRELVAADGRPRVAIAEAAGLSPTLLCLLLAGRKKDPPFSTVARLLAALGRRWADLDPITSEAR